MDDYCIWPTPIDNAEGKEAVAYVKGLKSDADIHHFNPAEEYTDPKTGRTVPVPGTGLYLKKGTNPYNDMV